MYFFIHKVKSPLFILSFIQYRFYQSSFTVLNKATGSKTPSVTEMEKKSLGETRLSRENQRKKVIINQDLDFLKIFCIGLTTMSTWPI